MLIEQTPKIYMKDWSLTVTIKGRHIGLMRQHRHEGAWYSVTSYSTSSLPREEYPWENKWKCTHCDEPVPDEMVGYITLIRWAIDAD